MGCLWGVVEGKLHHGHYLIPVTAATVDVRPKAFLDSAVEPLYHVRGRTVISSPKREACAKDREEGSPEL